MKTLIIIAIIILGWYMLSSSDSSKKKTTQAASHPVSPNITIPAVFYRIKEVEVPYTLVCWRHKKWEHYKYRVSGVESSGNTIVLRTSWTNWFNGLDLDNPWSIEFDFDRIIYRDENGCQVDLSASGFSRTDISPIVGEDFEHYIGAKMLFKASTAG